MKNYLLKLDRTQTFVEEIINASLHGIGVLLSVAALVILIVLSAISGGAERIVGCTIFGACLIAMYLASTLYHSVTKPSLKYRLKIFDHASIYLLIAGSYTPILLVTFPPAWGWSLFGVIWGLALSGVIFKLFATGKFEFLSTLIYVLMGWLVVVAAKPLIDSIPFAGIMWLLAGGLFYTFGVIFYAWKRLRFSHALWHIFVLGGSICHFFAILFYVVPMHRSIL